MASGFSVLADTKERTGKPCVNRSVLDLERMIEELRGEVSDKQETIVKLQKELDKTTQEQTAEITKLQKIVEERDETIQGKATEITKLQNSVKEKDESILAMELEKMELQCSIKEKVETITQEETEEVMKLQTIVQERDETIQKMAVEITELRNYVKERYESMQAMDVELMNLQCSIKEKVETMQEQAAEITNLRKVNQERDDTIQQKDTEITKLLTSVNEKDENMKVKDAAVTKLQNNIREIVRMVQEQATKLKKLPKTEKERDILIQELNDHAMKVVQSSSTPALTHVISADGRNGVVGVTSVDDRLFVLRKPSQQSIEVYDLKTFSLQQQTLKVNGLSDDAAHGLTACVVDKCLYVSDYKNASIYKVQLTVDDNISKWSVGGGPSGLSINTACNLLVACWDEQKIQEYTKYGLLVRDVPIKSNDGKLLSPFHVIQLTSGQFVVGCLVNSRVYDVVELDAKGQVLVSYTNQLQSTTKQNFSQPCHLAVDKNNECILVADYWNSRIVILNRSMNCRACEFNVMSVDGGLQYPSCLHFNESQGRLFVGEDSDGSDRGQRVLVFDNVINIANSFQ